MFGIKFTKLKVHLMFNLVSSRDVLNIFSIFLLCFPASITAVRDGLIAGRVQPNEVALRFQACP